MNFSLISLSILAVSQYGSAFMSAASPRAFAQMSALKSSTKADTLTMPVSEQEATYLGDDKADLDAARTSSQAPTADIPQLTPAEKYLLGVNTNFPIPPEVFKGISLGSWNAVRGVGDINDFTVQTVFNKFIARDGGGIFESLLGKSRASPMDFAMEAFTDLQGFKYTVPSPEEYKFFGNGDHEKQLPMWLKTNPFMASA
eukprot:CAMPEP_0119018572 /NCGR_PEP_ID=MMETSP1176-20130426/19745_1 /TAXON_ID=265551 /ORGANISM="Synedropsis recta cf, Strain CCMP1620" /LENGTH=199 /DNA_ID=CAMNT_0006972601 /DNA_START=130 /DNA_END=726 /DNA_ORIENTATION=-